MDNNNYVEIVFEETGGVILTPPTAGAQYSSESNLSTFVFTLNNYSEREFKAIKKWLDKRGAKWIIGKEMSKTGTPHLQGYIEIKATRFKTVQEGLLNKAAIYRRKGTAYEAWIYCTKEGDYETNFEPPESYTEKRKLSKEEVKAEKLEARKAQWLEIYYKDVQWHPWQRWFMDEFIEQCKPNYVNWIYDRTGQIGKSFLQTYLFCTRGWVTISGLKAEGVLHSVAEASDYLELECVMMYDIPRSSLGYINYGMLEMCMNGTFCDSKYEGKQTLLPPLRKIVVFANEAPDYNQMSKARWKNVWEICSNGIPEKREPVVVVVEKRF